MYCQFFKSQGFELCLSPLYCIYFRKWSIGNELRSLTAWGVKLLRGVAI